MQERKISQLRVALFLLSAALLVSAEDKKVTLLDGQTAVLHDDFTWEYLQPQTAIGTGAGGSAGVDASVIDAIRPGTLTAA